MRLFLSTLLALGFLFLSKQATSQQYSFKNYGIGEGLTQSQVQCIVQDQHGYLWVGTLGGGICRFDGLDFIPFTKKNGLSSNFILSVYVKTDGDILIGTTEGLNRITKDSVSSNFTNSAIDTLPIKDINLPYIGTTKGLFHYENGIVSKVDLPRKCSEEINHLLQDDKSLHIATQKGIITLDSTGSTICKTDLNRVHNNHFTSILKRKDGNIWVGSWGGGISKLISSNQYTNYSKSTGLGSYDVSSLLEDSKGRLWIGSKGQGVSLFDGQSFRQIRQINGLSNNFVNTIFEDHAENIWFGTSNGLSKYEGSTYVLHDKTSFLNSDGGYTVFESSDSTLWISDFSGGVVKIRNGDSQYLNHNDGFTSKRVKVIYEDTDSTLWFGTDGNGLFSYKNGYFSKEEIGNVWVRDIVKKDSTLFIATLGDGLFLLEKDTTQRIGKTQGLPTDRINKMQVDSLVWLATDEGAFFYQNDSIFPVNNLPKERFTSFCKDELGNLFFGNIGKGVYILRKDSLIRLTSNLELMSDNIYALHWQDSILWVGSEKGLDQIQFNSTGGISKNKKHSEKEGFLGIELVRNSIYKDRRGHYWFGTVNGLTEYDPHLKNKPSISNPKIALNSIELFYRPIQSSSSLGEAIFLKNYEFPHNKNHFTFRFKAISPEVSAPLMYRWRLKGLDNIWSTPTIQSFSTYANLSSGEYEFEVQAVGHQVKSEILSQKIHISPPFWRKTWFIATALLIGALLIGLLLYGIIKRVVHQNQVKNEKLRTERRLIELEQQALRLQMNPHFLFNSLNAIKGAVAQKKTKEAKRSIDQFAKLMRALLDNSKEGFIPLHKEIHLIRQYLNLEQLNHSFDFDINVQPDIGEETMVPAMMIQPLVENAVLHGISPLKEGGKIHLGFQREEEFLICTIEDNGIGRKASREAKSNSVHKQESKAIKIIQSRLRLIAPDREQALKYIDKTSEQGTIVQLYLPIKEHVKTDLK